MLYTWKDLFFSSSLAVYIAVCMTVAAVRWGHKCEPYARHMDYYYPAWKVMVFCFFSCILLLPAVFKPQEQDSADQVCMMMIMTSFFYSAVILFSYFGKVLKVSWWRRPIHALSVPFLVVIISACVCTIIPGTQMQGLFRKVFFSVGGILAVVSLLSFAMALVMLAKAIRRVTEENYSNPEDFPQRYAVSVIWIPVAHVIVSWVAVSIGSRVAMSAGMLILSAINVAFLIGALSPHRAKDISRFENESEVEKEASVAEGLSNAHKEELLRTIKHFVEDEQAYLDSHLTLASLSRQCGANRTYVSQVMSERLGGFFLYINRCRLSHAARYKLECPDASVEDVAIASGFGSRQSFYNVRRQLEKT